MQCRICFEDGDSRSLLSPCQCRGTSSHIHRTCLDQYIQYYPDRICRVCHCRLVRYDSPRETALCWGMLAILLTLLAVSNAWLLLKLVFLGFAVGLCVYFLRRSLVTTTPLVFLSILVLLFLPGGDPVAVYLWLATLGALAFLYTIAHQLPAGVFVGFVVMLMMMGYVGFLILLAYHTLDPPAFTALLGLVYLGWYGWIHAVV